MRTHRTTLTLASALAAVTLLATGCSSSDGDGGKDEESSDSAGGTGDPGGSDGSGGSGSDTDAFDQAQKLRACLRDKGMDVPDLKPGEHPNASVLGQPKGTSAEKWSKALEDCGSGTGPGGSGGGGESGEQQGMDAQVKIAKCLRDQGFDMPDPKPGPDGSHSGWKVPGGADPDKFMKALNECAA